MTDGLTLSAQQELPCLLISAGSPTFLKTGISARSMAGIPFIIIELKDFILERQEDRGQDRIYVKVYSYLEFRQLLCPIRERL